MSTSKMDISGFPHMVNVQSPSTQLTIPAHALRFRRNGIEFRSRELIPVWTEMTVELQSPGELLPMSCTGVVVACTGNRHGGYLISMLFMNMSRHSQMRLQKLAAEHRV